jgi:nickel transport system ATP-binding protein
LELKDIRKTYTQGGIWAPKQSNEVLKSINLKIAPGSCLGLLGRSGSGKSTLGRIALGLETPDAGMVCYKGKDIKTLTKADYRRYRRNVQVVFQNALGSVNGRFRAFDIVAEPMINFEKFTKPELKEKVEELLKQVGLNPADGKKYPHQFSGGELQRICIARAIALQPEVIVLDEAVSSLDMLIQAKILTLLRNLQEKMKIAFLFISHDIRVVLRMTDQWAIMEDGRIVEETEDIHTLDQLTHPAFGRLLEAILPPVPA